VRQDHHEAKPLERRLGKGPQAQRDLGYAGHPTVAEAEGYVVALNVLEFIALGEQPMDFRFRPVHGVLGEPLLEVIRPLAPRLSVVEITEP
jgi:hypothetical protein